MAQNEELARLAGKIMADQARNRPRLRLYGWDTMVSLAAAYLQEHGEENTVWERPVGPFDPNQSHPVRVKAVGFDQVLMGPVELMKPQDGSGFDPRDGGKVVTDPPKLSDAQVTALQSLYSGEHPDTVKPPTLEALKRKGMVDSENNLTEAGVRAALGE